MSLPYLFPLWFVAKWKRQRGREVTVSLAILNLAELNLHQRPCPRHSLFVLKGGVNLPTNQPPVTECSMHEFWQSTVVLLQHADAEDAAWHVSMTPANSHGWSNNNNNTLNRMAWAYTAIVHGQNVWWIIFKTSVQRILMKGLIADMSPLAAVNGIIQCWPPYNTCLRVPVCVSPPKWHLNWFTHFCTALPYVYVK